MVEITSESYAVKFTISEFTDLISQEEWDRLYKVIAEKANKELGKEGLKWDDTFDLNGSIEFLVSK